ncbi:LppU/SCO3897 family protein [Streptomyces sp. NPDC001020]
MTTPPPQGQNPYAQQPTVPVGQQPGQPGVPPQQAGGPGVPPQAPYAPFPNQGAPAPVPPQTEPSKRSGKKAVRLIGTLVVAVIVIGLKFGVGWYLNRNDAETTSVGACMHNDGSNSDPKLKEVDCSSGDAQYKVVEKFDGSKDMDKCEGVTGAQISYVQYGNGHDVVLCLKEAK